MAAYPILVFAWFFFGWLVCDHVRDDTNMTKQTVLIRFMIKAFWPVVILYYVAIFHPLRLAKKWSELPDTPKDTLKQL